WIVLAAIGLAGGIHFFLKKTLTGKAMVACAVNQKAAWLSGIPSERMAVLAFAISTGCGAIAGIFIAPITMSSYDMGTILGLKGFCAAMIGGLGSLWGAFAGGILLGVLESLGAGLISSGLKDAIAFILLLLILYIRPGGLFAAKEAKRF
ncbi:MAG TPA: branched-chain amino acid ABC transporter permease, partial [Desulfobacteraceae bacterium]|nr:branched-chain amino acid ABC transporter permease [Desulfobacteraceae bacterium]